jgi:Protein of unknown function (DUF3501)
MPRDTRTITADDMLDLQDYAKIRKDKREENVLRKRFRRLSVGPHVTVFFESYDTMWMQVQEMLFIEKGGDAQLVDELAAYNPMIPQGSELTATLMFEIDDERVRKRVLNSVGGIEEHIYIGVGVHKIYAVPEQDVDRTNEAGKASSVHFLHFPFTDEQIAIFNDDSVQVTFCMDHPNYGHMAIIQPEVKVELARDF